MASKTNEWGADPDKYKRMAEPFESVEQCAAAMEAFVIAVGKLREQYKIPEVIVQFQAYAQNPDGGTGVYCGGGGWGDQLLQCTLARRAADQEMNHLVKVIGAISAAYPDAHDMLITDPGGDTSATER